MHPNPRRILARFLPTAVGVLLGMQISAAQTVIMPLTPSGPSPAAVARDLSTGTIRAASASSLESALASGNPLLRYGPFSYTGNLSYRYMDGSRLRTETGNQRDTSIQAVVFSGTLSAGRHWNISHTTTASFYSNDEFRDPIDHGVTASAGYALGEWSIAGSLGYSLSNDTILEIGAQTTRETYNGSSSFSREIGDRTSLDLSVSYNVSFATGLVSGRSLSTSDWVNYQISKKLKAGAGFSYGTSFVSVGADADFVRPQLQVSWQPTVKTSIGANAGYEYRTFRSDGRNRLVNPVYSVSLGYRPIAPTSFSISASASEGASFFANRTSRTTGLNFGVEQRLLRRFFLSGTYSVGKTTYLETDRNLIIDRQDKHDSWSAAISTAFLYRASLSASYNQINNASSSLRFDGSSYQYSVNFGYRF